MNFMSLGKSFYKGKESKQPDSPNTLPRITAANQRPSTTQFLQPQSSSIAASPKLSIVNSNHSGDPATISSKHKPSADALKDLLDQSRTKMFDDEDEFQLQAERRKSKRLSQTISQADVSKLESVANFTQVQPIDLSLQTLEDANEDLKKDEKELQMEFLMKRFSSVIKDFQTPIVYLGKFDFDSIYRIRESIVNEIGREKILHVILDTDCFGSIFQSCKQFSIQIENEAPNYDMVIFLGKMVSIAIEILIFTQNNDLLSKFHKDGGFDLLENLICWCTRINISEAEVSLYLNYLYDLFFVGREASTTPTVGKDFTKFISSMKSNRRKSPNTFDAPVFRLKPLKNSLSINSLLRLTTRSNSLPVYIMDGILVIIERILTDDMWNFASILKTNIMRTFLDLLPKLSHQQQKRISHLLFITFYARYTFNNSVDNTAFQELLALSCTLQLELPLETIGDVFRSIYSIISLSNDGSLSKSFMEAGILKMAAQYTCKYSGQLYSKKHNEEIIGVLEPILLSLNCMTKAHVDNLSLVEFLEDDSILCLIEIDSISELILSIFENILRLAYEEIQSAESKDLEDQSFLESASRMNDRYISIFLENLRNRKVSRSAKARITRLMSSICRHYEKAKESFVLNNGFLVAVSLILMLNPANSPMASGGSGSLSEWEDDKIVVQDVFIFLEAVMEGSSKTRLAWKSTVGYQTVSDALEAARYYDRELGYETICCWLVCIAVEFFPDDFHFDPLCARIRSVIEIKKDDSKIATLDPSVLFNFPLSKQLIIDADSLTYVFKLLGKCNDTFQIILTTFVTKLLSNSEISLSKAAASGILQPLLDFYKSCLQSKSPAEPLLLTARELVRLLSRFRPSSTEVHGILSFVEESNWESILDTIIEILEKSQGETYVQFDHSQTGMACIECNSISSKYFPPSNGYSVCSWVFVDQYDTHTAVPLRMFSISPSGSVGLSTDIYIHRGNLVVQLSSSKNYYLFKGFVFEENKWYHVAVIHHHNRLTSSSLKLIVNGNLVEKQRVTYIVPSSSNFVCYIGTSSNYQHQSQIRWKLGSLMLFDDILSEDAVRHIFKQGRSYFPPTRNAAETNVLSKYVRSSVKIMEAFNNVNVQLNANSASSVGVKEDPMLFSDHLILCYNGFDHWRICVSPTGNYLLDAKKSLTTEGAQETTILFNKGKRSIASHGVTYGGCSIQRPYGLADGIHYSGGLQILFPLVEKCTSSVLLNKVLLIIGLSLSNTANILHGMEHRRSYNILAFLLKKKATLIDERTMELLWKIVGLYNSGHNGFIANTPAFNAFFIDFGIWENTTEELQELVLVWMLNALSVNDQRDESLEALKFLNPVFWILNIIGNGKRSENLSSVAILVLQTILTSVELQEDHFKLVLDFIFASVSLENLEKDSWDTEISGKTDAVTRSHLASNDGKAKSIKNSLLEMLLSVVVWAASQNQNEERDEKNAVGIRIKSRQSEAWRVVKENVDFTYLFGILAEDDSIESSSRTSILVLKILDILLAQEKTVLDNFREQDGFSTLKFLLIPYCGLENIFGALLCMLVGKPVHKHVPHHFHFNIIVSEKEIADMLLKNIISSEIKVPEFLEVVFFLLKFTLKSHEFVSSFMNQKFFPKDGKSFPSIPLNSAKENMFSSKNRKTLAVRQSHIKRSSSERLHAKTQQVKVVMAEPKMEHAILRILLQLFDASDQICSAASSSDSFLYSFCSCLFNEKFITAGGTSAPQIDESKSYTMSLNFDEPLVRNLLDIMRFVIIHSLRFETSLLIGKVLDFVSVDVSAPVMISYQEKLIHYITSYISNDISTTELRTFPKLGENLPKMLHVLSSKVSAGISAESSCKIISSMTKLMKKIMPSKKQSSSVGMGQTKANQLVYDLAASLNECVLTHLAGLNTVNMDNQRVELHNYIVSESTVFFCDNIDDDKDFILRLLGILFDELLQSTKKSVPSTINLLTCLVQKKIRVIEDTLRSSGGITSDLSEVFYGFDYLIRDDVKAFFSWIDSKFTYVGKFYDDRLKNEVEKLYSEISQSKISHAENSNTTFQVAKGNAVRIEQDHAQKNHFLSRSFAAKRENIQEEIVFRIFRAQQAAIDLNKQLQSEWNHFQANIRHIRALRSARSVNEIKPFFPSVRWRLDFTLGKQKIRQKLNRCEAELKFEKSVDLNRFIRSHAKLFKKDSGLVDQKDSNEFLSPLASPFAQGIDPISMKALKETRKRVQKLHKDGDGGDGEELLDDIDDEGKTFADSKEISSKSDDSWLQKEGWLNLFLEATDEIVCVNNCSRIDISDEHQGVLILCKQALYVIDGFRVNYEETETDDMKKDGEDSNENRENTRYKYTDIAEIYRRRYLLQPAGIEVIFQDGMNLLLVFSPEERDIIYKKLFRLCPHLQKITEKTSRFSPLLFFNNRTKEAILKKFMYQWLQGEISNFTYLMHLNSLAGRTFNDLNQYPVFPWILQQYILPELNLNDPNVFRDLSKPIGALTPNRADDFKSRYEAWDDPDIPKFHYGTHYSSAGFIMSYLVRLEPYTQHLLHFQSGKFDQPDRMFHSIPGAWDMLTRPQMSDVKELIPEFFFFPEFLLNGNRLHMGFRANGDMLDDVVLPPWAGDAREFIYIHRMALESPFVSAHINEWIDLIFGYKQRGQAAIDAVNVFYYLTYEGQVDFRSIEDPLQRLATIDQIKSFGQTPSQLFSDKLHPNKLIYPDNPKLFRSSEILRVLETQSKDYPIGFISESADGKIHILPVNKQILPPNGKFHVSWGFPDGSLRIGTPNAFEDDTFSFKNMHRSTLTAVAITPDANKIITGGDDSMIAVWNFTANNDLEGSKSTWFELAGFLNGHVEAISCLKVSSAFSVIVSASKDRTLIVWDLNRLLCSFSVTGFSSNIVDVAISEETGDIVACTRSDICVWDINGRCVASYTHSLSPISCVTMCCSLGHIVKFSNIIITGHEDGSIFMWEITMQNVDLNTSKPSLSLTVSASAASNSWGSVSKRWVISSRRSFDRPHKLAVRTLFITSDKSGFWSADWSGTALFWSAAEDDVAEDCINVAAQKLCISAEDVRGSVCVECNKKQWKRTDRRYGCNQCKSILCSGCVMNHIRVCHRTVPPTQWLPHLGVTSPRMQESRR